MEQAYEAEVAALCNEQNGQNDGFTYDIDPQDPAYVHYVRIAREFTDVSSLPDAHYFIPQYIDEELQPRQCSLIKACRERLQVLKRTTNPGDEGR